MVKGGREKEERFKVQGLGVKWLYLGLSKIFP